MVAEFLAGVIVGALIGLAIAPVLRTWILWKTAQAIRDERPASREESSFPARSER